MTFEYNEYGSYSKHTSIELTDEICEKIKNIAVGWIHNEEMRAKLRNSNFIREVLKSEDYLYVDEIYGCSDLKDDILDALYGLMNEGKGAVKIDFDSIDSDYEIND